MKGHSLTKWEAQRYVQIKKEADRGFYPTCQDMDLMIRIVDKLLTESPVQHERERRPRETQEALLF